MAAVGYRLVGDIALIEIDNPPVNALGEAVRQGLWEAAARLAADAGAKAAVIAGAGRMFSAGADVAEFGRPRRGPPLAEVITAIEALEKPVVACLTGAALGGACELALGCHGRVMAPDARIGLPEVTLGLLPGAGGTQRAPRLVGLRAAVEMMTSGRHIAAEEARQMGLVDAVAGDPRAAAFDLARRLAAEPGPPRRVSALPLDADAAAIAALGPEVARRARGQEAPLAVLDAVAAGAAAPDLAAALAEERRRFEALMQGPQHRALIHAFRAERQVARPAGLEGVAPREVAALGIVGGGTMGAGIAAAMLTAGLDVVLVERDAAAAEAARGRVAAALEAAVRRGLPEAGRAAALARFRTTLAMADLAGADLVIEAVFEDLEVKQAVFRDLDRVCKPGAVLASNTSYLDIGRIAAATARPGDVLGLHFFSPANIMRLVEVVVAPQSAADAVATGFALARRAGKVAVRAGVCDGFIGNRILAQCSRAAQAMVLHGAAPQAVDAALVAFGYPMGPFAVADLAGLDIGWAGRRRRLAERQGDDPRYPAAWLDRLCEAGRFGQKTGRGIYRYPDGARRGEPDPGAEAVIAAARAEAGLQPRDFTADEIVARYMGAMVNEAARVLEEGIAERPLDIDVVQMLGYGHPRWRGGPMFWADTVGLARVLDDIRRFTADDPSIWTPAPLILDLVARGAGFGVLNRPGGAAPG